MLATDPLSLVFLGCIIFSGAFLLISMATGLGHGHVHVGHVGHVGHAAQMAHAGHVAHSTGAAHHSGQAASGHAPAGASTAGNSTSPSGASVAVHSVWSPIQNALAGSLNPLSVLSFLFVFGLLGYFLHNAARAGAALSVMLPALLGLCAAAGVGMGLTRLMSSAEGELTVEATRPEGRIGKVSMAIREGGVGEVIFARAGAGRQSIGATSATQQPIPVGTEVVILSLREGIANVEPWDVFVREVRAGRTPMLEAIEPPS
jgi:hypothetical protein